MLGARRIGTVSVLLACLLSAAAAPPCSLPKCQELTLVANAAGALTVGSDTIIAVHPQVPPVRDHITSVSASDDFITVDPASITFGQGSTEGQQIRVHANRPHVGSVKITDDDGRLLLETTVTVVRAPWLDSLCAIIGWLYFLAWSVSFYPQAWDNYKRKSVVGLNFDFLYLNLMGWVCYSAYNVGLFCVPSVRAEYQERHPGGDIPVKPNDVFFALHAFVLTLVTIYQTTIYEDGGQTVSRPIKAKLVLVNVAIVALMVLAFFDVLAVLTALTWLSFIKLGITIVKYCPQALMNYRRKSTVGWSIGNVLLDFTGGVLSMLQMILIAWNTDDFTSFLGNPTKFGLGMFSVMFDVFFMYQHFVLYRHCSPAKELPPEQQPLLQGARVVVVPEEKGEQ